MIFDEVFKRFAQKSPLAVMAQLVMQQALSPEWLNDLFEQHRERQYTRQLLFSTEVELMALVALGMSPSLHAAAQANEDLPVSLAALYDKVNHTEPDLVRALVQGSAERLAAVMRPMKPRQPVAWSGGYRVRVLDGNHLAGTEKRLGPLRGFRGAALPGQSLVVYAPEDDLVVDIVPCEDAHAQERALMGPVLERVKAGELWLADRNFSTKSILFTMHDKGAAFIIREHSASPHPEPIGPLVERGRVETGLVFEQAVQIENEDGRRLQLRRVELHLDEPTEDGESVIRVLTNAPAKRLGAQDVAMLYRHRWRIEGMFGRLESVLHSEVSTLGYPRAALLAFGVAVMAYNVLAVLQAAVEAEHPVEVSTLGVSSYYIATEVKAAYGGMMIALPESVWESFETQSALELSHTLRQLAAGLNPKKLRKHRRAPKKKSRKGYVSGEVARKHVATARVLHGQKLT